MTDNIIILGDSRVRGLGNYISNKLNNNINIIDCAEGGADVEYLVNSLERVIDKYIKETNSTTTVIFSAGICSLTQKSKKRKRQEVSYCNPEERYNKLIAGLDRIWSTCHINKLSLITTTIYPISLDQSAKHFESSGRLTERSWSIDDTKRQQSKLELDLDHVNDYIEINQLQKEPPY